MRQIRRLAAAVVGALTAAASPTLAQSPSTSFYAGKTVTLLIGFGSGGGNDIWARMVARHMGKHLPGNPNIVPQNLPGAGGLLVANQLYNVSPKDGSVIALINRGIPMEPLLGGAGTQFDPLKFNWLGSPDRDTAICVSRKDSGVATMQDLFQKELVMGATGSGADSAVYPEFMHLLLGMKFKVVKGYKGSNEVRLAMERGAEALEPNGEKAYKAPGLEDLCREILAACRDGAPGESDRLRGLGAGNLSALQGIYKGGTDAILGTYDKGAADIMGM